MRIILEKQQKKPLTEEISLCKKLIEENNQRAMTSPYFEIFRGLMFASSLLELRIKTYELQGRIEAL